MQSKHSCKKIGARVILLVLALCMLFSVCLTACGKKENTKSSEATGSSSQSTDITGIPNDWTYGGNTFTFYIGTEGWLSTDIWVDEDNNLLNSGAGEPVYDAVIARINNMKEIYDCDIAVTGQDKRDGVFADITTHINASDNSFQAISTQGKTSYNLAVQNYLDDFMLWDGLDLEAKIDNYDDTGSPLYMWDQEFNDQMTINGHLYFLVGEISRLDNQMSHGIAFSKTMCNQYDALPSPDELYQLVRDGKWTLDKLIEYSKVVTSEVNGDGKIDASDRVGLVYRQTSVYGFLQGSEIYIAQKNADQKIDLTFYSDKTADLWSKLIDMANGTYSLCLDTDGADGKQMMAEDRCLFFAEYIDTFEQMRKIENLDFGILPMPKYDEAQKDYVSASHDYGTNFICVPNTVYDDADVENTKNVLVAMCYEGMNPDDDLNLHNAYYKNVLYGKTIKDKDSREMLDLIYRTKYYDLGTYMDWASLSTNIMKAWRAKTNSITSLYKSCEKRAQKQIENAMTSQAFADA